MPESSGVVITSAAGFLGTRLIRLLRDDHRIVAIDREPPGEIALAEDPRIQWHRIDLADSAAVQETFAQIRQQGGARALFHFAAYYDFTGEEHTEYQRTNIDAMRILLENCCDLGLERFIFASSVAACDYPAADRPCVMCGPGMWGLDLVGRMLGSRPFEPPWMAAHIDRQLTVDATHTQRRLDWKPHERLDILRRMPFMIENAKTGPMEWFGRNLEALEQACLETLRKDPEAGELKRELDDLIEFTIAFGIDQIQEIYEDYGANPA